MGRSRRYQPHINSLCHSPKPTQSKAIRVSLGALITRISTLTLFSTLLLSTSLAKAQTPNQTNNQHLAQASYPVLTEGSTGSNVRQLQATLRLLGFYQGEVNGVYSPATQAAVTQFQTAAGIEADGITGPSTWGKLLPEPSDVATIPASEAPTAPPTPPPAATNQPTSAAQASNPIPSGPPVLRKGAEGSAVAQLQVELRELGYYDGPVDGGFGEQTEAAVIEFQTQLQLTVDGVVGSSTWDTLTRELERN